MNRIRIAFRRALFIVIGLLTIIGFRSEGLTADETPNQQTRPESSGRRDIDQLALLVQTLRETESVAIRLALMKGMLSGLEGRKNVSSPDGWSDLAEQFATNDDAQVRELSSQLSQLFGDRAATARALAILKDPAADVASRRAALHSLLNQQNEDASNYLKTLLDEPEFVTDAIRGYASVENAAAPKILLQRYAGMNPVLRRCVVETLASRKTYAEQLLNAIEQKTVAKEDIPTHVVRTLHRILGKRFANLYGEWKPVAEDREKQIAKYKAMLTPDALAASDASRGRGLYMKTCAACHLLYGEGGKIGPDLTGSNRANLDYILLNSVDPSYDVPAGYRMVNILTFDGRVVSGVVAEEDDNRVILKTVEQPRLVISKDDIDERAVAKKSMMPDGQLDAMKPQDVIDLIRYLQTTEQVEMPK